MEPDPDDIITRLSHQLARFLSSPRQHRRRKMVRTTDSKLPNHCAVLCRVPPGKFDVSHASQNPVTGNAFSNRHSRSTRHHWQCLPEWLLSPRGELPLRQAHRENSARASQYQLANAIGSDFPAARQLCPLTFTLRAANDNGVGFVERQQSTQSFASATEHN